MRPSITVIGAGATGAYLAALLSSGGLAVQLVARGHTLAAIRERGIVVRSPGADDGELHARPDVVAPDEVATGADFVLFCVKAYDNESAFETVGRAVGPGATLVSLQNGIRHDRALAEVVGADRLLVSALYVAAERPEPGVVLALTRPRVLVGPYAGVDLTVAARFRSVLAGCAIDCDADADVAARRWEKWVLNCALNALTTVTGCTCDQIMATPSTRRLFESVVEEAVDAAEAAGAPVAAGARDGVLRVASSLRCGSSMAEDLRAGRPLEREEFTGELLRLVGQRTMAPVSATLDGILELLDPAGPGRPRQGQPSMGRRAS